MALANLGLVRKVAYRMKAECTEPYDDLYQVGCIGLLKACRTFDASKGNAFSSYAIPKIRGEILHFLRDKGWSHIKIPRDAIEARGMVRLAKQRLEKLGRLESEDTIALAFGIDPEYWQWIQESCKRKAIVPIEEVLDLAQAQDDDSYDRMKQALIKAIAKLPKTKREIVTGKWFEAWAEGITEEQKEEQLARRFKMPVEDLQTILAAAIATIKHELSPYFPDSD